MKGIPQVVDVKALLIIILDGFDGRQFVFIDPVHELSRFSFFVSDFLNFDSSLDFVLEYFPTFKTSCHPKVAQCKTALLIPPTLGVSCDLNLF